MKKLKKVKIFGKSVPILVLVLLGVGLVSAALLPYYGRITGAAVVSQSVTLDGQGYTPDITGTWNGNFVAGKTFVESHWLKNNADVDAGMYFLDTVNGLDEVEGITTKYYKFEGATTETVGEVDGYNLDATDDELCAISNNVDFETSYEGDNVVFKICTPDGFAADMCCDSDDIVDYDDTASFAFDVGDDGGSGWNGYDFQVMYEPGSVRATWPSGEDFAYTTNDPNWHHDHYDLDTIEGVSAEKVGDCLVVTVSTDNLGGLGSSYGLWLILNDHTGLYGCTGGPDQLTVTPGEKDGMTIGTEILEDTLFTIGTGETMDFALVNEFDLNLIPGTYTIITKVMPE